MLREEAKRTILVLTRLRHEVLFALGKNHIDFLRGLALTSNADDRQYTTWHVDFDEVAFRDQRDRPAVLRLRATMSDDRASGSAGEAPRR